MRRLTYALLGVAFLLTLSGVLAVTDGDAPRTPLPVTQKAPPLPMQGRGSRAGCGVTIGCTPLVNERGGQAGYQERVLVPNGHIPPEDLASFQTAASKHHVP